MAEKSHYFLGSQKEPLALVAIVPGSTTSTDFGRTTKKELAQALLL